MAEMNLDMAELKPSVYNLVLIFLAVLIVVPVAKYVFTKYEVPGLSNLVQMI